MTFEPCPACGLSRRVLEHNARVYAPPFGEPVEYTAPFLRCLDCTDSFEADDGAAVEAAYARGNSQSATAMLEHLEACGFSLAYMERALDLEPRTLTRCKAGDVSRAELALLRLVRAQPSLLAESLRMRIAASSNGRTPASDAGYLGSNPGAATEVQS